VRQLRLEQSAATAEVGRPQYRPMHQRLVSAGATLALLHAEMSSGTGMFRLDQSAITVALRMQIKPDG
jgi:hypothetical protein